MKRSIPFSLLAAFAAAGFAAAEPVYTNPVGYVTQELAANQFNLAGITVQTPTLIVGVLTDVIGADVSDTNANFTTVFGGVTTAIFEVKSGAAAGTVQPITVWDGGTITLPAAISGLSVGDSYSVRSAPTIEETFGSALTASFGNAGADIIFIPDGTGAYDRYFFGLPGPVVKTFAGALAPNVPLIYVDGIFIQKKASTSSLIISGEVKLGSSNVLLTGGVINPVSIVAPVGMTLFTSGLSSQIQAGFSAAGADIVWVPNGTTYDKYGLRLPGPVWQKLDTGGNFDGVAASDFGLPSSILIQRKGVAVEVSLSGPPSP